MQDRERQIQERRLRQPVAELERKVRRSDGRHSRRYYTQERLDLAKAEARQLHAALGVV